MISGSNILSSLLEKQISPIELGRHKLLSEVLEQLHLDAEVGKIFVDEFYTVIVDLFGDIYEDLKKAGDTELNAVKQEVEKMVEEVRNQEKPFIVMSKEEVLNILENKELVNQLLHRGEVPGINIFLEDYDGAASTILTIYSEFNEEDVESKDFVEPYPYLTRLGGISTLIGSVSIQYIILALLLADNKISFLTNYNLIAQREVADRNDQIPNRQLGKKMKLVSTVVFDKVLEHLITKKGIDSEELGIVNSQTYVAFQSDNFIFRTLTNLGLILLNNAYQRGEDGNIGGQKVVMVTHDAVVTAIHKLQIQD